MISMNCLRVDFLVHGDEREPKNIWFLISNDNTVFTLYGRAFSLRNVDNIDNVNNILTPNTIPSCETVYALFSNTLLNKMIDYPDDIFEIEWIPFEKIRKVPITDYATPEALEAWDKYITLE
jgi:hypothetical protein